MQVVNKRTTLIAIGAAVVLALAVGALWFGPWRSDSGSSSADRPGGLARLLGAVSAAGGNLIDVEHVREGVPLHVRETGVQLVLETRGPEHADAVIAAVRAEGYEVTPGR